MIRSRILAAISIIYIWGICAYAQTQDTVWRVPALDEFHEIMHPIWHESYPAKDYEALKKYSAEINEKANAVYSAVLPGIQRDKQLKWNEGIVQFQSAVEDYNKYASADDHENLLKAAENLHSKYEMLVRIIRPVLKEVDDFHKTLYVVYHDYLPNKKYTTLGKVTDTLIKKAKAITKAKLPARLESKQEAFNKAASELLTAAQDLKKRVKGKNKISIDAAVENMHTKYENLEEIFE